MTNISLDRVLCDNAGRCAGCKHLQARYIYIIKQTGQTMRVCGDPCAERRIKKLHPGAEYVRRSY